MIDLQFQNVIDAPWIQIEPLRLGNIPSGQGTPDVYVLVQDDDTPLLRVDLYSYGSAFEELKIWNDFVVIGFGYQLHLISLQTKQARTFDLDSYFGHLYALDRVLLAATGKTLWCIDQVGELRWVSDWVGIDGVIVEQVDRGIVVGRGEWDPPGGWRPFQVSLASGKKL